MTRARHEAKVGPVGAPRVEGALLERWQAQYLLTGSTIHDPSFVRAGSTKRWSKGRRSVPTPTLPPRLPRRAGWGRT